MTIQNKIDWNGIFYLVIYSSIFGLLAVGLPEKICKLNGFYIDCFYGKFASCVVLMLIFYVFSKDIEITK